MSEFPINHKCIFCGILVKSRSRLIEIFGIDDNVNHFKINKFCKQCRIYLKEDEEYKYTYSI